MTGIMDIVLARNNTKKAGMEMGSDPLNQMDGSGRSWLSTLLSRRLLAMPFLDLGFTHSSFNNRPMQC
jgi:hypothetical protein